MWHITLNDKNEVLKEGVDIFLPFSIFLGISTLIYLLVIWFFLRDYFFSLLVLWLSGEWILIGIKSYWHKEYIRRANIAQYGKPHDNWIKITPFIFIILGIIMNISFWLALLFGVASKIGP